MIKMESFLLFGGFKIWGWFDFDIIDCFIANCL